MLEDMHVWQIEKVMTAQKNPRPTLTGWLTWREGTRTNNIHLGAASVWMRRVPGRRPGR